MDKKGKKLIGCATVIEEARSFFPPDMEYHSMDAKLHNHPEKLKQHIQEIIQADTERFDIIIIGYGRCSKAAIGLSAEKSTLIVPRVDDCIALFLGSQKRYRKLLKENLGTYYLSPGWIKAGATLVDEFKRVEARYGKQNAEFVKKEMLKHFTRLAFIDMGYSENDYYIFAREAADILNLSYEDIKGTTELIKQMIHGPWDNQFVVANPGKIITYADFEDPAEYC